MRMVIDRLGITRMWCMNVDLNRHPFADKMLLAASQGATSRTEMSVRNQRIVEERADWDKNFPLLLSAYDNLLAMHRKSG